MSVGGKAWLRALLAYANLGLASLLLLLLAIYGVGAVRDALSAISSPLQGDYGEGIVWQQAALIPGPRMYQSGAGLPFIVFHYPPLFYLLTQVGLTVEPNLLASGRLVSVTATAIAAATAGGLVLKASAPGRSGRSQVDSIAIWCAVVTSLLVLSLHAVRNWGLLMRVDMVAVAFGLLGLLVSVCGRGGFGNTLLALLFCTIAVFGKQTEFAAGISVFLIAFLRSPRAACAAAVVAGLSGFAVLGWLEWQTAGGFLHNIIGYNVNRFSRWHAYLVLRSEQASLPVMLLILAASASAVRSAVLIIVNRSRETGHVLSGLRKFLCDGSNEAQLTLLVYVGISSLMLLAILKSGSSYNYFLGWLIAGAALLGVWLCRLARTEPSSPWFALVVCVIAGSVMASPLRTRPDQASPEQLASNSALVQRIADATKPVASENMTLLMEAGKPVIFEPAIVTELAKVGRWDEQPLVDMIQAGGFAFMIITDDVPGDSALRTRAVDAAMRANYPRVEQLGPSLWLRQPALSR